MYILGIETSCDETAAAIVEDGTRVLSSCIASAAASFAGSGGVIPEDAARAQLECILPTIQSALNQSRLTIQDLSAIAVTAGPGLLGSLLVGTCTARALAHAWQLPVIPVHHTLGHLSSTWLDSHDKLPIFPILTLSVSGGHTELWLRRSHTDQELLGTTLDDAAGEAFDKGAKLLGLGYPGGPLLARLAERNQRQPLLPLPVSRIAGSFNFSFSGLKTALLYHIREHGSEETAWLAASYQSAICTQLTRRVEDALGEHTDVREVHVVGGVSANGALRAAIDALCAARGVQCRYPMRIEYCTDNAAMIAGAAYWIPAGPEVPFVTFASGSLAEKGR